MLSEIRGFVRDAAARASFQGRTDDVLIAASEACANVIRHSGSANLVVTWASMGGLAEIRVEDFGVFRANGVPEVPGASGYGIGLMRAVADEFEIERGTEDRPGTRVRIVFRARMPRSEAGRPAPGRVSVARRGPGRREAGRR